MNQPSSLELNEQEFQRSQALKEKIISEITSAEFQEVPFSQFMNMALYEPGLGYYMASENILGPKADFVTAPEIGDVFAKCLAQKINSIFQVYDVPRKIFEFGAGSGLLAAQLFKEFQAMNIAIAEYSILEPSPVLNTLQLETLNDLVPWAREFVCWRHELPQDGFDGIMIANEILDAMPVEIFKFREGEIWQAYVKLYGDQLGVAFRPRTTEQFDLGAQKLKSLNLAEQYVSEIHFLADAWLRTVAENLRRGSLLIIDYGFTQSEYYHEDRSVGTLVCHRHQQLHYDPLTNIGCQDISAHVDFTAIANTAQEQGLQLNGFTTLGAFLIDCGILELNAASDDTGSVRQKFKDQLHLLTAPSEMGELFKVLELTRNLASTATGFREFDHSHRL